MRFGHFAKWLFLIPISLLVTATNGLPTLQQPLLQSGSENGTITPQLFSELEELARIVDIAYCVGMSGIQKVRRKRKAQSVAALTSVAISMPWPLQRLS